MQFGTRNTPLGRAGVGGPTKAWQPSTLQRLWIRIFAFLAVLIGTAAVVSHVQAAPPKPREPYSRSKLDARRGEFAEFRKTHDEQIETLAQNADEKNLKDLAAEIRAHLAATQLDGNILVRLPRTVQPEISLTLPEDERQIRLELRRIEQAYAKSIYLLSRRALNDGYPNFTWDMVREVVRHDSDHEIARKLLGYWRQGNEWVTPYAARMMRSRNVWHDKFGWIPAGNVPRYERGERYFSGRWMSAEQETALRQDFKNAWEVRTDHFLVKTNHSLERGVEIAQQLETFHDYLLQTLGGFFHTPEELEKLFRGQGGALAQGREKPYVVHYYRTRDEYIRALRNKEKNIQITNGIYYPPDRIAYFFEDPQRKSDGTVYHEATHQIMYEMSPHNRPIAERAHFWITEGIACYMESFRHENGTSSTGDPNNDRIRAARYRFLQDGYYIPLAEFDAISKMQFQTDAKNIYQYYSQASGLTHFFMHYDNGRYRDALVTHLAQLYDDNPSVALRAASLAELTGGSYAELDRQYGEYIRELK